LGFLLLLDYWNILAGFGENVRFHSRRFLFVLCIYPVNYTLIDELLIFVDVSGRLLSNAGRLNVEVLIDIGMKLLLNPPPA
jgi:hypothetical protein